MELISIAAAIALAVAAVIISQRVNAKEAKKIISRWESWPTVDEYISSHNKFFGKGISCYKCGSHQIWEAAFAPRFNYLRIHYCKQCKTHLYRTEGRR